MQKQVPSLILEKEEVPVDPSVHLQGCPAWCGMHSAQHFGHCNKIMGSAGPVGSTPFARPLMNILPQFKLTGSATASQRIALEICKSSIYSSFVDVHMTERHPGSKRTSIYPQRASLIRNLRTGSTCHCYIATSIRPACSYEEDNCLSC